MITLSEAFRLCGIKDETVYLAHAEEKERGLFVGTYPVSAKTIRNKTDMKKIIVHRIDVQFDYDGQYRGMVFVVNGVGLSEEDLVRLQWV